MLSVPGLIFTMQDKDTWSRRLEEMLLRHIAPLHILYFPTQILRSEVIRSLKFHWSGVRLSQGAVKVNFQIIEKIIQSDNRQRQRPKISPSREESFSTLSRAQASLLRDRRPAEPIHSHHSCIFCAAVVCGGD